MCKTNSGAQPAITGGPMNKQQVVFKQIVIRPRNGVIESPVSGAEINVSRQSMRRLTNAILAMVLALPTICFADIKGTFFIPDETAKTVQLKSYEPEGDIATLTGLIVLSGRYDIGWIYDGEMPLNAIEVRFTPIDGQWKILPQFNDQSFPPYLNVKNIGKAMQLLLSPELAESLEKKEIRQVSGSAQIVLRDIRVGVECGLMWYELSVERLIQSIEPAEVKGNGLSPSC